MKHWNTPLTTGSETLVKVRITIGVFHGKIFSSLLFVIFVMLLTQKRITVNSAYVLKIGKI